MRTNLTNESIEKICSDIEEFFASDGINRREMVKTRIMAEEALLMYRDEMGQDTEVEVNFARRFSKLCVQINVFCRKMNPFGQQEDGVMKSLIGTDTDSRHTWKYISSNSPWIFSGEDRNELLFVHARPPRISSAAKILIGIAVAIITALVCRSTLSQAAVTVISEDYITPIANAYAGLLGVMAILLIFFSIPLCMVQYGSTIAFQKDARRLIGSYVKVVAILIIITALVGVLTFPISKESAGLSAFFKPILDIFLGFVPTNLIEPFRTFNCMQVMIIGLLFGAAFLVMGEQAKGLANAFDKINLVAVIVNNYLTKFVPIYAGLMVFSAVLTNSLGQFGLIWVAVVTFAAFALGFVVMGAIVSIKYKIRFFGFVGKLMPSFLINLLSANVGASFIVFFNELTDKCGVDVKYTGLSTNLGTVLFKPMYSVFLAALGFTFAYNAGNLSVVTVAQVMVMAFVLPAAIPNIQGGAASVIVILLSSLGLTDEATQAAVTMNSLLQFIIVPVNIFMMQCVIVMEADKIGKLNKEILRKE